MLEIKGDQKSVQDALQSILIESWLDCRTKTYKTLGVSALSTATVHYFEKRTNANEKTEKEWV